MIFVNFTDHPKRYWIVVDHDASLCLEDPRFDIDVTVRTDRSTMYRIYLGHVPLAGAHRAGRIELAGSRASVRRFIDAFHHLLSRRSLPPSRPDNNRTRAGR